MKEGKEGRGRCAGSVAVSKLALVPVGDVLCCAVLCLLRIASFALVRCRSGRGH